MNIITFKKHKLKWKEMNHTLCAKRKRTKPVSKLMKNKMVTNEHNLKLSLVYSTKQTAEKSEAAMDLDLDLAKFVFICLNRE